MLNPSILLVFVCSALCAPVSKAIKLQASGANLSSTESPEGLTSSQRLVASRSKIWKTPSDMSDLSCFNVLGSSSGNAQVVKGVPAQVTSNPAISSLFSSWNDQTSAIQVFYPQGSINPGNKIVGGAEFYAAPISLISARNVSLEYSVFFPLDFDWQQGGKLPGLYGGHKTCSGGDSALTCFSTRLMWRKQGAGELYLYAPKDKQTQALCSAPPRSICESSYGLSIARGSFSFTPGGWTHVKQTVALNTPGQQDGTFTLEVDGKISIDRRDVYYRSALGEAAIVPETGAALPSIPRIPLIAAVKHLATPSTFRNFHQAQAQQFVPKLSQDTSGPPGFTGIFFSTFFGGHTADWATPKDQYAWFKDFAMSVNDQVL